MLSRQRTTRVLIKLRGFAGLSAPLLFAYGINRFSHGSLVSSVIYFFLSYEPAHDKTNKRTYVPSEDSDQPGCLPSQIRL